MKTLWRCFRLLLQWSCVNSSMTSNQSVEREQPWLWSKPFSAQQSEILMISILFVYDVLIDTGGILIENPRQLTKRASNTWQISCKHYLNSLWEKLMLCFAEFPIHSLGIFQYNILQIQFQYASFDWLKFKPCFM